ncbi:hypothetical protein [Singulisphaera sp. PoT]|uniref:hypothetical protein n=1 Tax=Singulisphaera sp. PoT TaxID=3411797 RepID=UPI003BF531B2
MIQSTALADSIAAKITPKVQADAAASKDEIVGLAGGFVLRSAIKMAFGFFVSTILPKLVAWGVDALLDYFGSMTFNELTTLLSNHKMQKASLNGTPQPRAPIGALASGDAGTDIGQDFTLKGLLDRWLVHIEEVAADKVKYVEENGLIAALVAKGAVDRDQAYHYDGYKFWYSSARDQVIVAPATDSERPREA